jgi:hypothetical protein
MKRILHLALLSLAVSCSVALGSSSLPRPTATSPNNTTTNLVVSTSLRRSDWINQDDNWIGKMKELDLLASKLLRGDKTKVNDDDDDDVIQLDFILHDDHEHQILTHLFGLDYEVLLAPEDALHYQEQEAMANSRNLQQKYQTMSRFDCYRTVDGTFATMQDLATNYATLVTYSDIGKSYEKSVASTKGYPVRAMKITAPSSAGIVMTKRAPVLITAGLHAREYAPPEFLTRFAEKLVAGYGTDADITWILNRTVFHLIPLVNPDGRKIAESETSPSRRKNTHPYGCSNPSGHGVDLNRQFPFAYGLDSGSSSSACSTRTSSLCVFH